LSKIDKITKIPYNNKSRLSRDSLHIDIKENTEMGKTILFGILVAILVVSFFGVDSAQASTKKPKPTKTVTKTKTKTKVPTATPKPQTPKPQPTQVTAPAPDFHWESENNPTLLTETGDYTMAWWSWFKFRPNKGTAFFLVNHFEDKSNGFGTFSGSAFSPNGQVPEIVTTNLGERKVVFEVYRNAMLIAPGSGRCIVAAQTKGGPKVGKWGLPAGVNIFLSEVSFQDWLARNR